MVGAGPRTVRFRLDGPHRVLAEDADGEDVLSGGSTDEDADALAALGAAESVATIARLTPQQRHGDFPAPTGGTELRPLFDRAAVRWLLEHDEIEILVAMPAASLVPVGTGRRTVRVRLDGHPWTGVTFASAWGSRDVLDVPLVRPDLLAELSADRAVNRGGMAPAPGRDGRGAGRGCRVRGSLELDRFPGEVVHPLG
ncbi:hypothetical protein [Streptomyces sp. NPDC001594]|uniref:hypothetical protein n=1 Tax=Streptomyces sp. NPDC001594 TaxID=3364590 RepID=UPI0036750088